MKTRFNELPSTVKIAIYVGISTLLATLVTDLEALQALWYSKYLVIALAVPTNILAYLILNEEE